MIRLIFGKDRTNFVKYCKERGIPLVISPLAPQPSHSPPQVHQLVGISSASS